MQIASDNQIKLVKTPNDLDPHAVAASLPRYIIANHDRVKHILRVNDQQMLSEARRRDNRLMDEQELTAMNPPPKQIFTTASSLRQKTFNSRQMKQETTLIQSKLQRTATTSRPAGAAFVRRGRFQKIGHRSGATTSMEHQTDVQSLPQSPSFGASTAGLLKTPQSTIGGLMKAWDNLKDPSTTFASKSSATKISNLPMNSKEQLKIYERKMMKVPLSKEKPSRSRQCQQLKIQGFIKSTFLNTPHAERAHQSRQTYQRNLAQKFSSQLDHSSTATRKTNQSQLKERSSNGQILVLMNNNDLAHAEVNMEFHLGTTPEMDGSLENSQTVIPISSGQATINETFIQSVKAGQQVVQHSSNTSTIGKNGSLLCKILKDQQNSSQIKATLKPVFQPSISPHEILKGVSCSPPPNGLPHHIQQEASKNNLRAKRGSDNVSRMTGQYPKTIDSGNHPIPEVIVTPEEHSEEPLKKKSGFQISNNSCSSPIRISQEVMAKLQSPTSNDFSSPGGRQPISIQNFAAQTDRSNRGYTFQEVDEEEEERPDLRPKNRDLAHHLETQPLAHHFQGLPGESLSNLRRELMKKLESPKKESHRQSMKHYYQSKFKPQSSFYSPRSLKLSRPSKEIISTGTVAIAGSAIDQAMNDNVETENKNSQVSIKGMHRSLNLVSVKSPRSPAENKKADLHFQQSIKPTVQSCSVLNSIEVATPGVEVGTEVRQSMEDRTMIFIKEENHLVDKISGTENNMFATKGTANTQSQQMQKILYSNKNSRGVQINPQTNFQMEITYSQRNQDSKSTTTKGFPTYREQASSNRLKSVGAAGRNPKIMAMGSCKPKLLSNVLLQMPNRADLNKNYTELPSEQSRQLASTQGVLRFKTKISRRNKVNMMGKTLSTTAYRMKQVEMLKRNKEKIEMQIQAQSKRETLNKKLGDMAEVSTSRNEIVRISRKSKMKDGKQYLRNEFVQQKMQESLDRVLSTQDIHSQYQKHLAGGNSAESFLEVIGCEYEKSFSKKETMPLIRNSTEKVGELTPGAGVKPNQTLLFLDKKTDNHSDLPDPLEKGTVLETLNVDDKGITGSLMEQSNPQLGMRNIIDTAVEADRSVERGTMSQEVLKREVTPQRVEIRKNKMVLDQILNLGILELKEQENGQEPSQPVTNQLIVTSMTLQQQQKKPQPRLSGKLAGVFRPRMVSRQRSQNK